MTTQTATPPPDTAQTRQRRKFTVAEYYAMAEAGILTEKDRVELLDGDVVVMAAVSSRHAACVDWLARTLIPTLMETTIVRVRGPVRLNDRSEPEPDITLLARRDDFYASAHPGPQDVLLLIEVADSTLESDRDVKRQLYARAGIPEVWIVNLQDRRVETYTELEGDEYSSVRYYGSGENVAPLSFPDIALEVDRIIPA